MTEQRVYDRRSRHPARLPGARPSVGISIPDGRRVQRFFRARVPEKRSIRTRPFTNKSKPAFSFFFFVLLFPTELIV